MNSLQDARDSDLMKIEDAFKDPENRFWEKNSSEGIVGNSKVSRAPLFRTQLIRSLRYFEVIVLSLHLKSTPLFRTCQQQSTRRNSQATNKEWGPSSNRDSLTLQFVCYWKRRDSRANKPVVIRQNYQKKPTATEHSKIFDATARICWSCPTYNYCTFS